MTFLDGRARARVALPGGTAAILVLLAAARPAAGATWYVAAGGDDSKNGRSWPEAFATIRGRLVEHGASDGTVNDFGGAWSLFFRDPDGLEGEVLLPKDDATEPPA